MSDTSAPYEHPSFVLARSLPEVWRAAFPHNQQQALDWRPITVRHALAMRVLAVMRTRIECAWAAYIDAVPGQDHAMEQDGVLANGAKLPEVVARALFPIVPQELPYAD